MQSRRVENMKQTSVSVARLAMFTSAILLASLQSSAALTIGQAASLTLPELRKEVFGEVGSMIVDVDRPTKIGNSSKPIRYMAFYTRSYR
jgi:hypothetical protein